MSNKNPASDEYGTPVALVKRAAALLGRAEFDLDVCATPQNAKAALYFNRVDDGLHQDWNESGSISKLLCWMNPPYSNSAAWCKKAVETARAGGRVMGLLKVDPGLSWWRDYVHNVARKIWWLPRIWFVGATGTANFSSCFVLWAKTDCTITEYGSLYDLTPAERGFPERKRKQQNQLLSNFDWV